MMALLARIRRVVWWVAALLLAAPLPAMAQPPTEVVEYYAIDAVGSVRVVFDASGNILGRMDYAPFGGELFGGTNLPTSDSRGCFATARRGSTTRRRGRIRCARGGSMRRTPCMRGCSTRNGGIGTATA
jgi:hypothetical protein